MKGKGEKERYIYTHLNAEFQRIARRDLKKKKKPSSVFNAKTKKKKLRKTIEWERLEIS